MLPWHQMIILIASLLILNPLFITLNITFVSPPLAHVSNAISYLQFQSHSYNHPAAVIIVAEHPHARLLSKWTRERGCMDGRKEGTEEAKRQADFISAPRLLLLKTGVQRVVGNCCVFH